VTPVEAHRSGDALRLTIARPAKRNALSRAVIAALAAHLEAYRTDDGLKFLVLTGAGDRAFSSGGDLDELGAVRTRAEARAMAREYRRSFDALRGFPVPTIAALNGDALGGGAELAMACDLRIAAAHARIGFLQGSMAISTAWGGGIDLLNAVGASRAMRLLAGAEIFGAEAAGQLGLLEAVAPADLPFDEFIEHFCARFRKRTPRVMRGFKALSAAHRSGADHATLVKIEAEHLVETWTHADHWRAVEENSGRAGRPRDGRSG